MNISGENLLLAILGGIIPALFWLWFWLREDRKRPEPRGLIFLSFLAGAIVVPLVIPLQRIVTPSFFNITFVTVFLWATFEEVFKYLGSYFAALRRKEMDEPIDPMIYLITTALGFAALENTLFLINALSNSSFIESFITGNMRFIGATLLHTISSAAVGAMIALTFYKSRIVKFFAVIVGLALATILHTFFNFFIMSTTQFGIFGVFAAVWVLIVILILFFEKIKRLSR